MISKLIWILILVHSLEGQDYPEQCCYWYNTVPGNNSECYLAEGTSPLLHCDVSVPRDANNDSVGTVKWYRRNDSDLVDVSDEYEHSMTQFTVSPSSGPLAGLYKDSYRLYIPSITTSDTGLYWCQIVTNDTCLMRSPYVHILVNHSETNKHCPSFYYPVCPNRTVCKVESTLVELSPTLPSVNVTTQTLGLLISTPSPSYSMSAASISFCSSLSETHSLAVCLGATIPAAGLLLILLILLICCTGICATLHKKRKREASQNGSTYTPTTKERTGPSQSNVECEELSLENAVVPQNSEAFNQQNTPQEYELVECGMNTENLTLSHAPSKIPQYDDVIPHQDDDAGIQNLSNMKTEEKVNPLHTYELVLSQSEREETHIAKGSDEVTSPSSLHKRQSELCRYENHHLQDRTKTIIQENLSTSKSTDNHYNKLDHSIFNKFNKGIFKEVKEDSSSEDRYYSSAQVHRLMSMGKSSPSIVDDHVYHQLEERYTTEYGEPTQQEVNKATEDDRVYHVLEDANSAHRHEWSQNERSTTSLRSPVKRHTIHRVVSSKAKRTMSTEPTYDQPTCDEPTYDEPYKPHPLDLNQVVAKTTSHEPLFDSPKYTGSFDTGVMFDDSQYSALPTDTTRLDKKEYVLGSPGQLTDHKSGDGFQLSKLPLLSEDLSESDVHEVRLGCM